MGIEAHLSKVCGFNEKSILIDENNKWRIDYTDNKKDNELIFIIDKVNVNKLQNFRVNNIFIIFRNLINIYGMHMFGLWLLRGIQYLSLFYIILYISNIIELSFNLNDVTFFELSSIVIFVLLIINIILLSINYNFGEHIIRKINKNIHVTSEEKKVIKTRPLKK